MTQPMPADTLLPARRQIRSELFGMLEVIESDLLTLPEGLLGFPKCHSWALLRGSKDGTAWLQSADHPALVFLLVDPFVFFEGYAVDLSPTDLRTLEATSATQVAVFAIVTLPAPRQLTCTVNLQGPLLLNLAGGLGAQIVLDKTDFGIREELPIEVLT